MIDGFDLPPVAMMPYNAPYYEVLLTKAGFHKKTDLLAYELNVVEANDRSVKLIDTLESRLSRSGITIR